MTRLRHLVAPRYVVGPVLWLVLLPALACEAPPVDVLNRAANAQGDGDSAGEPAVSLFSGLSAGQTETCGVAAGSLRCWGTSPEGRARATPEPVPGGEAGGWVEITAGSGSHCARKSTGSVACWGQAAEGQLGQGDLAPRPTPAAVSLPLPAVSVRGRYVTMCAILEDGTLHCWGDNQEGQLAQNDPFTGDGVDALSPVRVGDGTDWLQIDPGQGHTCGVRRGGALFCWGRNAGNELGLGTGSAGQIRYPVQVSGSAWTAVAAGQSHTCAIAQPGTLHCFGLNDFAQLGTGDRESRDVPTQIGTDDDWMAIDVDTFHGCGLRRPGRLHCWGRNTEGQLGTGDPDDQETPVPAGDIDDWVQIAVGRFHTCARRGDGSLYCTGENDDGRLGTGDFERRNVMTRVTGD